MKTPLESVVTLVDQSDVSGLNRYRCTLNWTVLRIMHDATNGAEDRGKGDTT